MLGLSKRYSLPLRKIFSLFLIVSIVLSSSPVAIYASEEVSDKTYEETDEISLQPVEAEEAVIEETVDETVVEEITAETVSEETVVETEIVSDKIENELPTLSPSKTEAIKPMFYWIEQNGKYETSTVVEVGEVYTLSLLDNLKIEFTEINGEAGKLYIEEVDVPEMVNGVEVIGKGYDITSDMVNGTFKYDLYMPNPDGEGKRVMYSEDGQTYVEVDVKEIKNEYIKVEGLDHFTVFVVVNPNAQADCDAVMIGKTPGTTCFTTIQEAINNANDGDEIYVAAGTYNENLSFNKNITLLSKEGAENTTIDGNTSLGGQLGTVYLTNGRNGAQIGAIGQGFTILGLDGTPGLEKAAIYLQGTQRNIVIEGNIITARGDAALMGEYNAVNENIIINSNVINGKTFLGDESGVGDQWTVPNVARQAIVFGGGSGTTNTRDFVFTNNTVTTITGGGSYGNTIATLDLVGNNIIIGNIFNGTTIGLAPALRVRGSGTYTINNNVFGGSGYSLALLRVGSQINAQSNWWGDDTGPYDNDPTDGSNPADNPTGLGNAVAGAIDYTNWTLSPYYATIQGRVYYDTNAVGAQTQAGRDNGTQPNLANQTVRLYNSDYSVLEQEVLTSSSNPRFTMPNVLEGNYNVCVLLPTNYYQTWPQLGDEPLMLDGSTIYAGTITALLNASGDSQEGHMCWSINVNRTDGFDTYGNLKFGIREIETLSFGQEVTGTYGQIGRDGINTCSEYDHVYTNQADATGRARQVIEWTNVPSATSYKFRSFYWNGSSWIPTSGSANTIEIGVTVPNYVNDITGYNMARFANTTGFVSYTETDTVHNVFRYITMGTNQGTYTRTVEAYNGDVLIGISEIKESDLLIAPEKNNYNVCSKLTIDRTVPVVTFTQDVPANTVQSATIEINVIELHPDTTTHKYAFTDGTCDSSITFTHNYSSDDPFVIDTEDYNGMYICAVATDLAGNTSYKASANPLSIDNTPPTSTLAIVAQTGFAAYGDFDFDVNGEDEITMTGAHSNYGWRNFGWFTSVSSATISIDEVGTAYYAIVDSTEACPTTTGDYTAYTGDLSSTLNGLIDGQHKVCFYAEDIATPANVEDIANYWVFNKDTESTTIDVNTVNGENYDETETPYYTNSDSLTVNYDITDNLSGVARGRLMIYADTACTNHGAFDPSTDIDIVDNGTYGTAHKYNQSLDISGLNEGMHCVRIITRDEAGNLASEKFEIVIDRTSPTIDRIDDMNLQEGQIVNFGFLNDLEMRDEGSLDKAYVVMTYTGNASDYTPVTLIDDVINIEKAGCGYSGCGKGGTLNELVHYMMDLDPEVEIDFSDIEFPVDTSIINEGVYTIVYYVTDKAGNASETHVVTITITNVDPIINSFTATPSTITTGQSTTFNVNFSDPSYIPDSYWEGWVEDMEELLDALFGETTVDMLAGNSSNPSLANLGYGPDDAPWTIEIDYGQGNGYQLIDTKSIPGSVSAIHTYNTAGVYTVTVKVCEAPAETITTITATEEGDGDFIQVHTLSEGACTTATTTVTVNNPPAQPQGPVLQPVYYYAFLEEDVEEVEEEEEEEDGDVLGIEEEACEEKSTMSGYVFIDKNNNGKRDEKEDGVEDVDVTIYYYDEDDKKVNVGKVKTDKDGYWEIEVCPGEYYVQINEDNLPEDLVLGENDLRVKVKEDTTLDSVIFALTQTRKGMSWIWWVIIILLILVIAGLLFYLVFRKKDEEYN